MNAHFDQWRQNCSGNANLSRNAKPQLGDFDKLIDAELVLGVPKCGGISGNAKHQLGDVCSRNVKHQLGDVDKLIDAEPVLSVPSVVNLKSLQPGSHPKEVIADLSEGLLAHYTGKPLIDKYDVYQHLMDYWAETMQDDCYLIADYGWKAETYRIIETDKKGKQKDKGWTCDLVPKPLIVARYFAKEQKAIDFFGVRQDQQGFGRCTDEGG